MKAYKSANRRAALEAGLKHYVNETPCIRGHQSPRRVGDGCCQECNRSAVKKWRRKTGYKTDPQVIKEWRERQTADRLKAYEKTRSAEKVYERNIRKRAKMRSACPSWLSVEDRKIIDRIYKQCREITANTGISHEVDHILPINGKTVCGLHVPWNLRILTKAQNRAKFNKLENYNG